MRRKNRYKFQASYIILCVLVLSISFLSGNLISADDDAFEPNNSISEAKTIDFNTPCLVSIYPKKDHDYFKVTVTEPGYIRISTENLQKEIVSGLVFAFFDSGHKKIPIGYEDNAVRAAPGEYFFAIYNEYNNSSPQLFNITAGFIKEMDKFEDNNSIENAKELQIGKEADVLLFPKKDVDFFKVKTGDSGMLSVYLSKPQRGADITTDFYNEEKKLIAADANKIWANADNAYYIAIKPSYIHKFSTNLLSIVANLEKNYDAYEPNNGFETAKEINIPSAVKISLYPDGDRDYFKFEIKEAGYLTELVNGYEISKVGKGFYEEIAINVYDSDKKKIDSFDNKESKSNTFKRYVELNPGKYYAEIKEEGFFKKYLFSINFDFISKKGLYLPIAANEKRKDFLLFVIGLGMKDDLNARINSKILANSLGGDFILVENEWQLERAFNKAVRETKGEKSSNTATYLVLLILLVAAALFLFLKPFAKNKKQL